MGWGEPWGEEGGGQRGEGAMEEGEDHERVTQNTFLTARPKAIMGPHYQHLGGHLKLNILGL